MTDPIATLRTMRGELADMRAQFRNRLDPSRPVLICIDADQWMGRLDAAITALAMERASDLEIVT